MVGHFVVKQELQAYKDTITSRAEEIDQTFDLNR